MTTQVGTAATGCRPEFQIKDEVGGNGRKVYWVERRETPLSPWRNVMPGKVFKSRKQAEQFVDKSKRWARSKQKQIAKRKQHEQ